MKIYYRNAKLSAANKVRLDDINLIVVEYQNQGYKLTLRQLYYQLVSRDIIPNVLTEYAKLSKLLKEGRMAGIVDWSAIEDRLRVPYWEVDALRPEVLNEILERAILEYLDPDIYQAQVDQEWEDIKKLKTLKKKL